jgi:hypothetical protein
MTTSFSWKITAPLRYLEREFQSPNKILIPRVEHPPQPFPIIQRLNPPLLPAILDSTDPLGLNMFRDLQHQMRQIGTLDSLPARYLPLILWKYGTFNFDANTRLIARYGKTGVSSPKIGQEDLRCFSLRNKSTSFRLSTVSKVKENGSGQEKLLCSDKQRRSSGLAAETVMDGK